MAKSPPPSASVPACDPVEAGFLDARGKLIEVAAFLDRVERKGLVEDYRVRALQAALGKLTKPDAVAERAGSVLRALSDPTTMPAAQAGAPAAGAWRKEELKRMPRKKAKK
jgi:hypothetical protein